MVDSLSGHLPVFLMLCHVLAGTNTACEANRKRSKYLQQGGVGGGRGDRQEGRIAPCKNC